MEDAFKIIRWTIGGSLAAIVGILFIIRYLVLLYNKRNAEFTVAMKLSVVEKERALLEAKIEAQEETIQQISKELHDNVNQILTLAKLNLNKIESSVQIEEKIQMSKELLTKAIYELSHLSKSLSSQSIKDFGLLRTLEFEAENIKIVSNTIVTLDASPDLSILTEEEQLIVLRIFQESVRNSIMHGEASKIDVLFDLNDGNELKIVIKDNGRGFNYQEYTDDSNNATGQGLKNIIRRVNFMNARIEIVSSSSSGTELIIHKPVDY